MKIPASLLVVAAPLVACSGAAQDPEPQSNQSSTQTKEASSTPTTITTQQAETPPSTAPTEPTPTADAGFRSLGVASRVTKKYGRRAT